ncbi:MAG: TonB-dependent receptor [Acidobacteriota bacterium]
MMFRCALLCAVLVLPSARAAPLMAQSHATTANLAGTVHDETSGGLPAARITALAQDTGLTRTVTSEGTGRFTIAALPIGVYTLHVERAGFAPRTLADIALPLGGSVEVDIALTVTPWTDHADVVGTATSMPTAGAAAVLPQTRVDALPTNGRNFIAFSLLTPGVSPDATPQQGASRTSGLSFAGQRARSNNITIDGLDNNDETVGSVRAAFSQEAVKEFQVLTTAFSAEFGKASGGVVNVVTKSGANAVAGNAFGFFRDDALNGKGYFERLTPSGQAADQPKAPFRQKQFGATLGGPLRKDRAFFFGSFERLDTLASNFVNIDDHTVVVHPLDPRVALGTPAQILRNAGFPVDTGNVPYAVVANQAMGRVDAQVTPRQNLMVRVNAATEVNENVEPFGGLVARSRAAAIDSTDVGAAVAHTYVLSQRAVNELRGQVAMRNQTVRSLDPACGLACDGEGQGGPTLDIAGVASVGRQRFTPSLRDNTRYQFVDTAGLYRANHQVRAGFDISYIQGRRQSLPLYFGGRYIFQNAALPLIPGQAPVPLSGIQEVALGLPLAYVQGYGFSGAAYDTADLSLFAQDEWRVRPDTTLALGVRYQKQFWPATSLHPAGYPGTYAFPSDNDNIAPRVSVAWRPRASDRATVRAAYGIYYDNVISSVYGISKYVDGAAGVRTMVLLAPGAFAAWAAPGHQLTEPAARTLVGGSYPSVAITADPALQTPYAHHVSVGVDRALPGQWTLSANVVYVRGFDQTGTIDYNPLVPALGVGRRPADLGGIAGTSASVLQYTSFGETTYRGLLLSLEKRFDGRSQLLVGYTLSKAEDSSTDFQSAFLPENNGRGRDPANPNGLPLGFDPSRELGPSVQDQRHRLVLSGSYVAPGGLQVAAVVTAASGRPYNILAGADLNGDGDGGSPSPDRPRLVPSDPSTSIPRNSGRLPSECTVDVRITKRFRRSHGLTLDPMLEVFNLFNRTNFSAVQNVFGTGAYPTNPSPTFGQYTQAGAPRQAQLGLKIGF